MALLFLQFISCFKVFLENHIFYEKVSSIKMINANHIEPKFWEHVIFM